jgi:hypothetical protein
MWRVLCRDCSWDIESTQRDCSQCDACGSERVSVTRAATLDEAQHEAFRAYVAHVTPEPHVSCAGALLSLWERPWSPTALRFAYHALCRAYRRGLDVMEADDSIHRPAVSALTQR